MSGKVALVVGGNGGIGCVAADRLISDGMRVCATYFRDRDKLDALQARSGPDSLVAIRANVVNEGDVTNAVTQVLSRFAKVDVVVFAVSAPLRHGPILDLEWADYVNHVDVQLKPVSLVVHALREQIRSKRKTKFIVVLTEACVGTPPKGLSHYVTAKYAAMGLAKTMAVELAQYNCTTNMVSPGMVETALLRNMPPKLIEMAAWQNPLKRNAKPDDVSNVISFLASDQSDYLNGAHFTVNGGNVMM